MQIIIEFKNPNLLNRLLELLRVTEWMRGVRIWKKNDGETQPELIFDSHPPSGDSSEKSDVDYLEFWACIQPQLGMEATDRILAEMRED